MTAEHTLGKYFTLNDGNSIPLVGLGTSREMEDVVEKSLARSIGVSNFNQQQIQNIIQKCKIPPAVLQTECHAYLQIKGLVKFCQDEGIFVIAFAPFGSPGLSKHKPWYKECDILKDEVVLDLARKYGRTSAQILLRHLIQRGIGMIPKSSDGIRLRENINVRCCQRKRK
ncbi:aldo-keto reductase family 1 member B1-like [Mytilus californianus]|uniref:aldo-keto reductase family 1 member B1-like n=1 Tax=Mytilus californianus TaxID=6549 RepID=UPI002247D76B|nr:aldo-keto reductase family 1 member B1-like [Mytilus californianus]